MADDINKKISINVDINTDGQQQIDQYKAAFDGLRNTVSNLGKPLNDISTNIQSLDKDISGLTNSLNKLDTQNQSVAASGNKVKDAVGNVSESFSIAKGIIELLKESFASLEGAMTGGLTLLIAYAPEIIKWVGGFFKADTTVKSLNQTLRDHKLVLQAVNQARLQGDQNAQQELVNVKLLYKASQDQNLSLTERKKAVKELQSQYPDYFGNLSSETVLAGKATVAYNNLTQAILSSSRAKAAENILVQNSQRQLGDSAKMDDLKQQLDDKKKELEDADAEYRKNIKTIERGRGRIGTSGDDAAREKIDQLRQERDNLQKMFYDASNDSLILDKQNKALTDIVTKNVEKTGLKALTGINSGISQNNKVLNAATKGNQNDSPLSPQRDTTTLAPASSVGASQIDEQPAGFTNATIAPDDNIAAKPDPALVAKFAAAKQAAQQLKDFEIQTAQQVSTAAFGILQNSIKQQSEAKIAALENQKNAELSNTSLTSAQKLIIEQKYKQKEGQEKVKAFKEEQEASLAQAVINGALAITKATSQTGVLSPFVIPGIIAETAIQVATIVAQKPPAYASGGLHYTSDGKGGMLPGYSRTDNTNAYLRSGEGIVVSEAMRDPWARNLVSAINVGFGGRDFSTTTNGRGFAVGGIFTDGGDANRYYNAPVNDQKNLANSIAYQMINNFPPVYVDVKDVNNQQNILAQTINRVNL